MAVAQAQASFVVVPLIYPQFLIIPLQAPRLVLGRDRNAPATAGGRHSYYRFITAMPHTTTGCVTGLDIVGGDIIHPCW